MHSRRLPAWIRAGLQSEREFVGLEQLLNRHRLHTVCQGARCPNRHECWNRATATFMILGGVCTRDCAFCAVRHGRPAPPDFTEPRRVAEAARAMGLRHVVITSVTRDDLPDGGAGLFAAVIREVRWACPAARVEVLTPDFGGSLDALTVVLAAAPDVFNHNLETVRRLQPVVRPQASYERSLEVLSRAAAHRPGPAVKSGLMLGLGETDAEIRAALGDLRAAGCELLTVGQYLAPSRRHHPVSRYLEPEEFARWSEEGKALGFTAVAAGPLVRSSYRAEQLAPAVRRPLPLASAAGIPDDATVAGPG